MLKSRGRIIPNISVILLTILQAVADGCVLEIKLPLVILGYPHQDLTTNFNIGDTLKFACFTRNQITYSLIGSPKIQCDKNNQWSSKPPRCKATFCSPSPPMVSNAQLVDKVVSNETNKIGQTIHYRCNQGYSSSILTKVCQKDGYWQGNVNCTRITCPRPVLQFGQAFYLSLYHGSIVKYTCNKGYVLIGPSNSTCTNQGTWSGNTQPQCFMLCHELVAPLNGFFKPAQALYRPGKIITFKCISDKYVIRGSVTRTCQQDGQWTGSSTKCVVNRCDSIGPFDRDRGNVVFSRDPHIIGTEAKFTCFSGYKLIGASIRVCQRTGMWSAIRNPACTALSCGEPGIITNGQHTPFSVNGKYPYRTMVKYSCNSQYYLWGNASIRCTDYHLNPFWTQDPPECLTLAQFSTRCHQSNGHFHVTLGHPVCVHKVTPPQTANEVSTKGSRQLDTLTIVTASAGSTLGALVILLSVMVFVRRFHRNRRFRQHAIRSRFYSDDDHVTLIACPRGYHFSLPSYDEAMSQIQRDPPPFDTVVPDNATTVINNNINITLPNDDNPSNRGQSNPSRDNSTAADRTVLQVSADQQVNILNNPLIESPQAQIDSNGEPAELDSDPITTELDSSIRNSISSQESLALSDTPSASQSEDDRSINESQPLIGSN